MAPAPGLEPGLVRRHVRVGGRELRVRVGAPARLAPQRRLVPDRGLAVDRQRRQPRAAGRRGDRRRAPIPDAGGFGRHGCHSRGGRTHGGVAPQHGDAVRAPPPDRSGDDLGRAGPARAALGGSPGHRPLGADDWRRRGAPHDRASAPPDRTRDRARREPGAREAPARRWSSRPPRARTRPRARPSWLALAGRGPGGRRELAARFRRAAGGARGARFSAAPSLVLLAYVVAAVPGMIPITPGGLGFVEAGLTATLVLAGVPAGTAAIATLAYRLVSYWLPLPAGLLAYGLYRRRYGGRPLASEAQRVDPVDTDPAGPAATDP